MKSFWFIHIWDHLKCLYQYHVWLKSGVHPETTDQNKANFTNVSSWDRDSRSLLIGNRPLVDTFKKYLRADTDTYLPNVSIPIQIQHQKMYLCADTDTILQKFEAISWENVVSLTPLTLFIPWWCYNYYWLWCFTKNNSYDVKDLKK